MKVLIARLSILLTLTMGGCATTGLTGPKPLFPPPDEQVDMTGYSSAALSCGETKTVILTNSGAIPTEFIQFGVLGYCYYNELDPLSENGKRLQKKFISKGLALADQTCDQFFNKMELERQGLSYMQGNTNTLGTALVAALSFSGNHTRSIFNTATLLAVANGLYENRKANYILTPQIQKLREKIQISLRDPIALQMKEKSTNDGYTSFDDAKQDLLKYDRICSHTVLQDIVTDMVTKSELVQYNSSATSFPLSEETERVLSEIYSQATGGTAGKYTQGEIEALYAIASIEDEKKRKDAALAVSKFDPKLAVHIATLQLDTGSNASISELRVRLNKIGALLGLEKKGSVADIRKKIAEQVQADTNAPQGASPGRAADPSYATFLENNKKRIRDSSALISKQAAVPVASRESQPISFGYKVIGAPQN